MRPVVMVKSYGEAKPSEIISYIIDLNDGSKILEKTSIGTENVDAYSCNIKNKYYSNTICLLPFENDIKDIPSDIWNATEILIIYFDAENKSFLKHIPNLCRIVQNNNIGISVLLTKKLYDDSTFGLTYTDIKSICTDDFDVMELCCENDEKDQNEKINCNDYSEVSQALHNYIWPNIESPLIKLGLNNDSNTATLDVDTIESQLEAFESLLTNIQNFKKVSSTLKREEVLDQAEQLAELFANILKED